MDDKNSRMYRYYILYMYEKVKENKMKREVENIKYELWDSSNSQP